MLEDTEAAQVTGAAWFQNLVHESDGDGDGDIGAAMRL